MWFKWAKWYIGTPCGLTQSVAFKMEDPTPNPGSHTGHFYETEWVTSTTRCCGFPLSQISVAKRIGQSQHRMLRGNKRGNNKSNLFWTLQGACVVQNNDSCMWLSRQDSQNCFALQTEKFHFSKLVRYIRNIKLHCFHSVFLPFIWIYITYHKHLELENSFSL